VLCARDKREGQGRILHCGPLGYTFVFAHIDKARRASIKREESDGFAPAHGRVTSPFEPRTRKVSGYGVTFKAGTIQHVIEFAAAWFRITYNDWTYGVLSCKWGLVPLGTSPNMNRKQIRAAVR